MNFLLKFFKGVFLLYVILFFSSCSKTGEVKPFYSKNINGNWKLISSEKVTANGTEISNKDFDTHSWYNVNIPSTVLHALVENGVYKDIFVDENIKNIPAAQFKVPWWYRKEFSLDNIPQTLMLRFEGINYKANVWLNGKKIADSSVLKNTFRHFRFNISKYVKKGKNILAVEVFPPEAGDFSIGFVDWNPAPPDNNMGIFRNVYLEAFNEVGVYDPFIVTKLNDDNSKAFLTASVNLRNTSDKDIKGSLLVKFNGKTIKKIVDIKSHSDKKIVLTTGEFDELIINNPELWWPHTYGKPHLYHASFEFRKNTAVTDKKDIDFGIRTVSTFFTKDGHRGFKINGKKILIRGGGWVDRLLLDDTPESIRHQLEYVKDMNLNTIRLEGFWGKDQTLYTLCDKMGILIMVGWSCHWEWEDYLGTYCDPEYGGILKDSDIDMMSKAWQDQIVWLRNHPSIFTWLGGSDCVPAPKLEKKYFKIFDEYDSTRVYLPSAKEWDISLSGPSGVKMRGPYAYEPPVYWFADTLYGGAFGFNTETGPGAQVPPLESIKKMLSPQHRWPIDSVWNFHCGRHEFNTLDRYTTALEKRYGKAASLEDYTKKAQVLNYELMRPMFEAFSAYRYKATGVIQWMLNSAWPEMYWQLYDYYLMPNGAYYGAKKGSSRIHLIYDYAGHSVYAVNDKLRKQKNLKAVVKAYDINSKLKFIKKVDVNLDENSSKEIMKLPAFDWNKNVCFVNLELYNSQNKEIDENFYWISYKKDILDYKTEVQPWYYYTPSKQYADFTALNSMPETIVEYSVKDVVKNDNTTTFYIELKNSTGNIAFFINVSLKDKKTGLTILPVLWSDNYVSLLPNRTEIISATIENKIIEGKKIEPEVKWYNE